RTGSEHQAGKKPFIDAALKAYYNRRGLDPIRRIVDRDLARAKSEIYRISGAQPYSDFRSADSQGWRLMRRIIQQFVEEAAPVPVLIVPIPTYHFFLHGAEPIYQKLFDQLERREQGLHVLDSITPLMKLPWQKRRELKFSKDSHF